MSSDGLVELRSGLWASFASLFASSGTLLCCALPALLVALGAGAALSTLVAWLPSLVLLSEYKEALFGVAGVLIAASGWLQWRNRFAPCPTDPGQRAACLRTRKVSIVVYIFSVVVYAVGALFAFVLPALGA